MNEKKCVACGGIMIPAELHTDSVGQKQYLIVNNAKHELKLTTHVSCYICTECGRLDLYADRTDGLK